MSTNDPVQDQKQGHAESQFNKILNQYIEQGHVHQGSIDSLMKFKKKIHSKETTVSSAMMVIKMLNDTLNEKDIELRDEEAESITRLESLISGCSDYQVLTKKQLAAYNDVWNIHDKYSDKE